MELVDLETRKKLRFDTKSFVDAMSPSNFALTNPQVLKRTLETRGENLLKGLSNMLRDIAQGQLTQTKPGVFEVGKNLATTPGKVIKQTPLYQLIQYTPTTDEVLQTPVVIFPPWINRYYILDLSPENSFVKWCVDNGILDGPYMAATFNLLRGRDLIWNYVVNNYLLGEEPAPFDLLYWNSDTTNLPAAWHRDYLKTLYEGNELAQKGGISIAGTPIDVDAVRTPTYIQAGREDHIAPPQSVWKIMDHFAGPKRFVLAGSGHIAGVVNPPAAQKYQYWVNDRPCGTLEDFVEGATEHKGSWWPDWVEWLKKQDSETVKADGARVPGKGKLKAIEDGPGSQV